MSKKQTFANCTSSSSSSTSRVWTRNDDAFTNRKKESGINSFYIWTKDRESQRNYYSYRGLFLCPNCLMIEDDFDTFKDKHKQHAGAFTEPKSSSYATSLASRDSIWTNNDGVVTISEKESCSNSFYIWTKDRESQRNYYSYRGQFLCPNCLMLEDDFDTFTNKHKQHAGAFTQPKASSYANIVQPQQQQQQQRRPMPRKRPADSPNATFRNISSDLNNSHKSVELILTESFTSIRSIIEKYNRDILKELEKYNGYKIQLATHCRFERVVGGETEHKDWYVSNVASPLTDNFLEIGAQKIDEKLANYESHGSNWRIESVLKLIFLFCKYTDFCRLSGHSYIPTPTSLHKSYSVVNVQNKHDNLCFVYSILAVWKYNEIDTNHQRVTKYQCFMHLINYDEGDMPMRICNISKFERQNPQLRVNVLKYNSNVDFSNVNGDDDVYKNPFVDLLYKSKNTEDNAFPVNLLLLEDGERFHYVGVTNVCRLLNTSEVIHTRIRNIWCANCLLGFRKQLAYDKHLPLCNNDSGISSVVTMPTEKELSFCDWHKTISPKFVVYADFESVLVDNDDADKPKKHMPCAAAYVIVSDVEAPVYKSHFGEDSIVKFLTSMEEEAHRVNQWYKENAHEPRLQLTVSQESNFESAKRCYLCQKEISDKVRDHDHFTGKYLGAACNSCHLARRIKYPFLPVVFHNFRGYDAHHILKHAISGFTHWSLSCIPQTTEKFLALQVFLDTGIQIRFLDSLQFLHASLSKLVDALEVFPLLSAVGDVPDYVKHSKGAFPYNYANSINQLLTCDTMPSHSVFESKVSGEDYALACRAWVDSNCTNLADYMMLYLKVDVFQLAEVFESFRKIALKDDGLDPLNFFSIPGLSWASALKLLKYPLELIHDPTVYTFYEVGIRGGMTFVNKHRVTADANTDILYIDINNLYGWALSQRLPCSDFQWIYDEDELRHILDNLPTGESEIGYTLEVDLMTPDGLHDKLDELPPAPESKRPPDGKVCKLLLTHDPKQHYIIHYELLKYYLALGIIVTKVHRAIKFRQDYVFKKYVDYNSEMRALSVNRSAKDYYKLKSNSLYGKTVENIRKRTNLRLCNTEKKLVTYASKATFRKSTRIDNDLVAALLTKDVICLNKPVYIGQSVLDLSKLRMYQLQYTELQKYRLEFNCSIGIVAGDTDSFFLECTGVDVNRQLLPAMIRDELLDTSNYPMDHPLYSTNFTNKIGKFKDESCGKKYVDGVFLRPKLYSLLAMDESGNVMKAKGVSSTNLTHQHYVSELEGSADGPVYAKQQRIGSLNHQLFTFESHKLALSKTDDKRYWVEPNRSVAYGHYSLAN